MGSKPVRVTPTARAELLEAADYYDEQAGLGDEFLRRVQEGLDLLQESPQAQSPEPDFGDEGVRSTRLKRFPYRLVFVELPAEIRVLAARHVRRRPGYWHSRLSE